MWVSRILVERPPFMMHFHLIDINMHIKSVVSLIMQILCIIMKTVCYVMNRAALCEFVRITEYI